MWREPIVYVFLGAFALLALWALVSFIVARAGGWARLASAFPPPRTPWRVEQSLWFRSLRLGDATSYACCVRVRIAREGLVLSISPFSLLFHAPIHAPWEALDRVSLAPGWFGGLSCSLCGVEARLRGAAGKRVHARWREATGSVLRENT
jgi:hypothetical protein